VDVTATLILPNSRASKLIIAFKVTRTTRVSVYMIKAIILIGRTALIMTEMFRDNLRKIKGKVSNNRATITTTIPITEHIR